MKKSSQAREEVGTNIIRHGRQLVVDIMETRILPVPIDSTFQYAADILAIQRCEMIMIVDDDGTFAGIVDEKDLLRAIMPDIHQVDPSSTKDNIFTYFINAGKILATQTLREIVRRDFLTVSPRDELYLTAYKMLERGIYTAPVVYNRQFLGVVDAGVICWAILSQRKGLHIAGRKLQECINKE